MQRSLILFVVLLIVACGPRLKGHEDQSQVYGCEGEGSDAGGTEGPVEPHSHYGNYALAGCGDGNGDGVIGEVGKLPKGTISPGEGEDGGEGEEPLCLNDCSTVDPNAPGGGYLTPELQQKVKAIYHDPNLTADQKAEALKELLKDVIAEHRAGEPGFQPDLGATALALHNLIEKMSTAPSTGHAVAYFYSKYVSKEVSQTTTSGTKTEVTVSAQVGAKVGLNVSLPGAAKALIGGASAGAEAGTSAGGTHTFTKETKREVVEHEPPQTKERITLCILKENGQIVPGELNLQLNLKEPGDGPDPAWRLEQQEAERKKRAAASAKRQEENLKRLREEELAFYANAKVTFMVKSIRSEEYVELTPDLINSYNFLYGWFPADFEARKKTHLAAVASLNTAIKERDQKRVTVKAKLQSFVTTLSADGIATETLLDLPEEIMRVKGQICPEASIARQKEQLERTILAFGDYRNLYLAHAAKIVDLEPTDVLTAHFDQEAAFLANGRAALAAATDLIDICGQFNELHTAATLKIEQNRIRKFDAAAEALSDTVMAQIRESNRQVLAADKMHSWDVLAIDLAGSITTKTMATQLTEAKEQATLLTATLQNDILPAIAGDADLSDADKTTLSDRIKAVVHKEVNYLSDATNGIGLKSMIQRRHEDTNKKMRKIRLLLAAMEPAKRDVALSSWRGIVTASGMSMEAQCTAPTMALDPRCWTVEFDLAGAGAADAERFDAGLADLGLVMTRFLQSL